jgi:hypothetical protein
VLTCMRGGGIATAGSVGLLGPDDPTNSVMNPADTKGFTVTGLRFAGKPRRERFAKRFAEMRAVGCNGGVAGI